MSWWVYMIEADDGSLYTGVTTDIARRFREHQGAGRGARYFKGRRPLAVVYLESQPDRSAAQRREAAIRKLKRSDKLNLKQNVMIFHD
ncbi:MAG: GIY-YIG nuclease family protein [Porticoccaceae bacterium]